jgi:phage recombination protein Bet
MANAIAKTTTQPTQSLAVIPARIKYPPALCEQFGISPTSWKVLCEAIFPEAQGPDSIALALSYCKSRNLDIMKRPVHIVGVWNSKLRQTVDTIWPGIGELRTTAMRTGEYAGRDETVFGPDISIKVGTADMTFPEWAQTSVYRIVKGTRCKFTGPKVYWLETYAQLKRDDPTPNSMWRDRPRGQLDKCSEAATLRATFPEEIGNDYIPEEASGRQHGAILDAEPATKRTTLADLTNKYSEPPADPNPALDSFKDEPYEEPSREPGDEEVIEGEVVEQDEYQGDGGDDEAEHYLRTIKTEFDTCNTIAAVGACYTKWFSQAREEHRKAISAMATAAKKRVGK